MQLAIQIFHGEADEAAIAPECHQLAQSTLSKNFCTEGRKHHYLPVFVPPANVPTSTANSSDVFPSTSSDSPTSVIGQSSSQPPKKKRVCNSPCRFLCQYINELEVHKVTEHDLSYFHVKYVSTVVTYLKGQWRGHRERQHLKKSDV